MSAPAAKAFSDPVTTIAPTPSSASKVTAAAVTSSATRLFKAFNASGRFRVIHPTRPRCSTRMVSYSVIVKGLSVVVVPVSPSATTRDRLDAVVTDVGDDAREVACSTIAGCERGIDLLREPPHARICRRLLDRLQREPEILRHQRTREPRPVVTVR